MERVAKKLKWSDETFKRRIGTTKAVFGEMIDILQKSYDKRHQSGGNPNGLSVSDKLLITLQYYREYRTMELIAADFDCSKSTVYRSIVWVENTLAADARFQLPGKKALQTDDVKTVAVDVTEHPIERPQKNRRRGILGKKSVIR